MYKETLVKLVEEARTRAEEYVSLNIQATLKGEEIDKELYHRNLNFLLGEHSGLKRALEQIEKLEE